MNGRSSGGETRAKGGWLRARGAAVALLTAAACLALSACGGGGDRPSATGPEGSGAGATGAAPVRAGVDVLLAKRLDLVEGKRVGLITNQTGVDGSLRTTIDRFKAEPAIRLVALYGPEHGVRGNAQAGEYVPFYFDDKFGLPVFSLYGQSMKPDPGMLKNIDSYMRAFDTKEAGKVPEAAMVEGIDVLIFDIQDVGTRVYTYVSTMAYAMQAATEAGTVHRPRPAEPRQRRRPGRAHPRIPHTASLHGLFPIPSGTA
jgi:uncharacterized protein YbbC (DUF1343 family)